MRIQTILNRVEKFKSFVHGEARLEEHEDGPALVIQIEPRKNSRPFCSACGRRAKNPSKIYSVNLTIQCKLSGTARRGWDNGHGIGGSRVWLRGLSGR